MFSEGVMLDDYIVVVSQENRLELIQKAKNNDDLKVSWWKTTRNWAIRNGWECEPPKILTIFCGLLGNGILLLTIGITVLFDFTTSLPYLVAGLILFFPFWYWQEMIFRNRFITKMTYSQKYLEQAINESGVDLYVPNSYIWNYELLWSDNPIDGDNCT